MTVNDSSNNSLNNSPNNSYANDENIIALQGEEIEVTPPVNSEPQSWTMFVPFALMLVVFYFLLLRPQEKKRKAHESLVKSVKKGDGVIINGGIYGTISRIIDDNSVEIEIAQNVVIKVLRTAIAEVQKPQILLEKTKSTEKPKIKKDKKSA